MTKFEEWKKLIQEATESIRNVEMRRIIAFVSAYGSRKRYLYETVVILWLTPAPLLACFYHEATSRRRENSIIQGSESIVHCIWLDLIVIRILGTSYLANFEAYQYLLLVWDLANLYRGNGISLGSRDARRLVHEYPPVLVEGFC